MNTKNEFVPVLLSGWHLSDYSVSGQDEPTISLMCSSENYGGGTMGQDLPH